MGRGGLGIEDCVLPSYDALVRDDDALLLHSLGISAKALGKLYTPVKPLPPIPEPTVFYFKKLETDDEILRGLKIRLFTPKTHDEYVADDDAKFLASTGITPRRLPSVSHKTDLDLHRMQALEQYLYDASVSVEDKFGRLLEYVAWAQRPDQKPLDAALVAVFPYAVEAIRSRSKVSHEDECRYIRPLISMQKVTGSTERYVAMRDIGEAVYSPHNP
jgi:hypothetical protein